MSLETGRWVRIPDDLRPLIIALLEDAGEVQPGTTPPPQLVAKFFLEAAQRWMQQAAAYRKLDY